MKKNTFKDYKEAIRQQYEQSKSIDVSGILAHPTPAQLRNFCMLLYDKGLSKKDEEVFGLFFEKKEGEALKKAIDRVNIDKFRSIISFLRRIKDTDNPTRIEIAAILVDFKQRPYVVFSHSAKQVYPESDLNTNDDQSSSDDKVKIYNATTKKSTLFLGWLEKNKLLFILGLLFLLVSSLGLFFYFFPEKDCMQWHVDQYINVDCNDNQYHSLHQTIITYDERLVDFRKIVVDKSTPFFNSEGKPLVWYCKIHSKRIDFFNSIGNGFHPETGNALRPISTYIVKKYVMGE